MYRVITDRSELKCSEEELLRDFSPVVDLELQEKKLALYNYVAQDAQESKDICDIIKANIKKLETDPSYIPNAKAINDSIKTLLAVKKTQIEIIKLAKDV